MNNLETDENVQLAASSELSVWDQPGIVFGKVAITSLTLSVVGYIAVQFTI